MLTDTEKKRLINREKETDAAVTHRTDLIARTKLQRWIKDIPDVLFILNHLPKKQLTRIISDTTVFQLWYLSEKLMKILSFRPIWGQINAPDKWVIKTNHGERAATDKDINRSIFIDAHRRTISTFWGWSDPAQMAAGLIQISPEERSYQIRATGAEPEKVRAALDRVRKAITPEGEPPK
jgi:hypothetical protein